MNTLLRFAVAPLLLALPAPAWAQAKAESASPTQIALVTSDKSETVRNVLTLAEAKLSQTPGLKLLERQAIDKVLAEQKLSLSGVVATDQALTIGKLLSVDLFAVLEASADKKEAAGLVIFDAKTGVRLWDAALPAGTLDETVNATVDAVRTAEHKRVAVGKLRPVCVMTVRNADLPRDLDVFCDSVGLLLERQLVASPDLAVLERQRLEQVNKERDLPTDSPLRPLLASVVTIELEVGASPDRKGLRATALLSDGKGKPLGKVTATVAKRDAAELSRALLKELAKTLDVKPAPAVGGQAQEAQRFLREAEFFREHKDYFRALRAAESAYALQPEDHYFLAALARGLLEYAIDVVCPGGLHSVRVQAKVDPEKIHQSLGLARRGSELLVALESSTPKVRRPASMLSDKRQADIALREYLTTLGGIKTGVTEAHRDAIDAVRNNRGRLLTARLEQARSVVRDHPSFVRYTETELDLLMNQADRFIPPAQWADAVCHLQSWAEIARKREDVRADASEALLSMALHSYQHPRNVTKADSDRVQQFWTDLEGHPNATISYYGRLGGVVHALSVGKLSDADAGHRLRDFRLSVQKTLEKDEKMPDELRLRLYEPTTTILSAPYLPNKSARIEELKELCEFMLRRKELHLNLVVIAAQETYLARKTPDYRYADDLVRRALPIAEGKEGRLLARVDSPASLNRAREQAQKTLVKMQADIHQADPTLGAATEVPWEKVTTLIDVYPNKEGVLWLQGVVVHEGSVYIAGIRREGTPAKHSVQLLRVTPGKEGKWEGRAIEVALSTQPEPKGATQVRRGLSFATSACIHQDRYYLGTKAQGIFVFPFDDGRPERITTADGLPSDAVQGLVGLDGRLYAFLGEPGKESYIVSWDVKSRKCDVLASSRRKEKRSAFDNNTPLVTTALMADPARNRILLVVHSLTHQESLNGVWALNAKSGEMTQLFPLNQTDQFLCGSGSRVEGDRLLLNGAFGIFVYDLAKKDPRLLFDGKVPVEVGKGRSIVNQLEKLPNYRITPDAFVNVRPPHVVVDGWLWGAWPFCRRTFENGKREPLPSLRAGSQPFQPTECLQLFKGNRELLVGDSCGLWLVTLRKD